MKCALLALVFMYSSVLASDLVWDDIVKVPVIKVKNELQSCDTKGWKIITNQDNELSGEYICSQSGSWGRGIPMQELKQ